MFATDLVIKPLAAPTTITPPLFPVSPINESDAFAGSSYAYSDLISPESFYVGSATNITGFGAVGAIVGTISNPDALTQAELAIRPGVMYIVSTSAGSNSHTVGISLYNQAAFPNGPRINSTMFFRTPSQASNATDEYSLLVGNIFGNSAGVNTVPYGGGIFYSHTVNGGNWQFREFSNGVGVVVTSSNVPFVPSTWYRMSTTYNIVPNAINCILTPVGGGTATTVSRTVASSYLSGGVPLPIAGAGLYMNRVTSTGVSIATAIDYWSITVASTGRSF